MELVVADNPEKSRYEAIADGELAGFINYHLSPKGIALTHAETDSRFRGKGVGGRLVQGTLDDIEERGLGLLPYCPFVRGWLDEHPDYVRLVPADRRPEFGL